MRGDSTAVKVAVVSGAIFIVAGLVKFVFHRWELHAFREFGLPWPSALEILAGVLETAGGVLLMLRTLVVPTALTLAATMVVAIGASGIGARRHNSQPHARAGAAARHVLSDRPSATPGNELNQSSRD